MEKGGVGVQGGDHFGHLKQRAGRIHRSDNPCCQGLEDEKSWIDFPEETTASKSFFPFCL